MKGLILKDFINLKKNLKIMVALALLYAVMAFMQEDASFFSAIFTLIFAILLLSTYSYDEMSKWEGYALTMPVSRDTIIQGKYIVMLLLTFFGSGLSIIFTAIINTVLRKPDIFEGVQVCAGGAAVIIIFYSITIPIITKLGVEKARILFFAVYIIPIFTVVFVGKAVENGNLKIPDSLIRAGKIFMENIYVIAPLVVILALAISYMVSINIYRKKEF